jgi:hypothetical protein
MNQRFAAPRTPVVLERAFEDPDFVRGLVASNAPYWPVLRYVAKPEELAAVSQSKAGVTKALPPWFRGDWAYDVPLVEGADRVLDNSIFIEAAKAVFDAEVVRPTAVYVNLMAPLPFAGEGHIDVPAFRGIDRTEYPIWLLQQMTRSGLFADWQIDIATAVSWFYEGIGGAFDYWSHGPARPPERIDRPLDNRAVVGDNDFMFHRVDSIGANAKMFEASLDAELRPASSGSGEWIIEDRGRIVTRYDASAIRVSVSWKAEVYADEGSYRERAEHLDDLAFETVIDRFVEDLSNRGVEVSRPADPLRDTDFIAALSEVYRLPDLVYPTESETRARASDA